MDYEQMRQLMESQRQSITEVQDAQYEKLLNKYVKLSKDYDELKKEKSMGRFEELPVYLQREINSLICSIASHRGCSAINFVEILEEAKSNITKQYFTSRLSSK